MRNLLILTPLLPPAAGGSAAYTMILARHLLAQNLVERVIVAAEAFPGQPAFAQENGGRLFLYRTSPYRAGRAVRDVGSYLAYAHQQLGFLSLAKLVRNHQVGTVLVHSSLLYHPGTLRLVLRRLKQAAGMRIVLDVRDPLMPSHLLERPGEFDAVICCAQLLFDKLSQFQTYRDRLHFIPIPIEPLTVEADTVTSTLSRYGLTRDGFVFNGTGVSLAKSLDLLVEAIRLLHERGIKLPLVVAGRQRDVHHDIFQRAIERRELKSLGPLPHTEVLALAAGAALAVHPSSIETPSRMAIEGLMVGARSLLPREVKEFALSCPKLICADRPEELAEQIRWRMEGGRDEDAYDHAAHIPERVIKLYGAALRGTPVAQDPLPAKQNVRGGSTLRLATKEPR